MKTVNIKSVAERAGVSVATVSNVLNRPELVASNTRERVRSVIDALGYVPNHAARQLSSGQSNAVGMVLYDVRNPYFAETARGAEDVLTAAGHMAVLCNTDLDMGKEERYLDRLAQQRTRGVMITPVELSDDWLRRLLERGLRCVLFHNSVDHPEVCSVAVDDLLGGEQAATHLIARGHESITYVVGPMGMRVASDRYQGCRRAIARAGRPAETLRVIEVDDFTIEQGRRAGEQLLASAEATTAVFCANDLLALGVMQAAFRAGKRVPEDLAIVGYDDIDSAATATVPLTTVHVGGYDLGRAAARLIVEEERNPEGHEHQRVLYAPRLVERFST